MGPLCSVIGPLVLCDLFLFGTSNGPIVFCDLFLCCVFCFFLGPAIWVHCLGTSIGPM